MPEHLAQPIHQALLRGITVCVDYADILALTLPYIRHHFTEFWVVTARFDRATVRVAQENDAQVIASTAFYERGASFNKWLALERGLDVMVRQGWICILDADVLWPKELPDFEVECGKLYGPYRRNQPAIGGFAAATLPPESEWGNFERHKNVNEWAGYTQIFHADDPHLGKPPWHQTNWKHAGGADSFFQRKWPDYAKVRPPFEVLHLGEHGKNWAGRTTPFIDGTHPSEVEVKQRRDNLNAYMKERRGKGKNYDFTPEKIEGRDGTELH